MAELTLTLDKAMALANNEAAEAHLRVLGLLAAAAILSHHHLDAVPTDTADVLVGICESIADNVEEARTDG